MCNSRTLNTERTLDQLYSLQRVKFAQPVNMCCVDLVKTLTVSLGVSCWGVLHKSVVGSPLLRAIWSLYNWSRRLVCIAGTKSDQFPVHAGLRQCCPLSLILFLRFMDTISRCSHGLEGVQFGTHRTSSLVLADEVLLVSSNHDIQHVLRWFAAE